MGAWTEKVLPAIHKFLWKDDTKKAAAEQACKSFDESKDAINKEFEEKKGELKPKVVEIYEASPTEIKTLIKEPNGHDLKKHSAKVQNFLDELVIIDFPGSKEASETTSKYGPNLGRSPIIFIFEKVSTLIMTKVVAKNEVETPSPSQQVTSTKATTTEPPTITTTTTVTREIIVEKAVVKELDKGKVATIEPPVAATKAKEIIVEKAAIKELEKGKAATTEPPVTATTVVATTVTKEPVRADALAKNGKEPSKVEEKKEVPLKA